MDQIRSCSIQGLAFNGATIEETKSGNLVAGMSKGSALHSRSTKGGYPTDRPHNILVGHPTTAFASFVKYSGELFWVIQAGAKTVVVDFSRTLPREVLTRSGNTIVAGIETLT